MMTLSRPHLTLVLAAASVLTTTARAQQPIVIRDVRVFDGTRVIPKATVLARDGKIAAVGADVTIPAGAQVVDGTGRTLLPGLIDAHTHTFLPDAPGTAIAFGVTTQLEMFTDVGSAKAWRDQQRAGRAPGRPDIYSAGTLVTAPGGHGTQFGLPIPTLSSPAQADSFIAARIAEGSDFIKLVYDNGAVYGLKFPTLDQPTLAAGIAAARTRSKLSVVHVGTLGFARDVVDAGASGFAHLWIDSVPDAALVQRMVRQRMFAIPTLSVLESVTGTAGGAAMLSDSTINRLLSEPERQQLRQSFPARRALSLEPALETVVMLSRAGVPILAGTDAPNPGTVHGLSMHHELALLVRAGLTPVQALAAATSAPAAAFGLADRGRIATGLRADFIVVDGDPTTDILATRRIVGVWKAGEPFDRESRRSRSAPSATPPAAPPAALTRTGLTLADFETGAMTAAVGSIVRSTDDIMGGRSTATLTVSAPGAGGAGYALHVSGEVVPGSRFPWSGMMWMAGDRPMTPVNVSAVTGFRFAARGDGQTYTVMVFSSRGGQIPATRPVVLGRDWQEHTFKWSDFNTDGSDVIGVAIVAVAPVTTFEFRIDALRLE